MLGDVGRGEHFDFGALSYYQTYKTSTPGNYTKVDRYAELGALTLPVSTCTQAPPCSYLVVRPIGIGTSQGYL